MTSQCNPIYFEPKETLYPFYEPFRESYHPKLMDCNNQCQVQRHGGLPAANDPLLQWAENNLWGESRSFAHSFIPSFEHAPYNHRIANHNGQSDSCLPRYESQPPISNKISNQLPSSLQLRPPSSFNDFYPKTTHCFLDSPVYSPNYGCTLFGQPDPFATDKCGFVDGSDDVQATIRCPITLIPRTACFCSCCSSFRARNNRNELLGLPVIEDRDLKNLRDPVTNKTLDSSFGYDYLFRTDDGRDRPVDCRCVGSVCVCRQRSKEGKMKKFKLGFSLI
ncbi:uncharacterized protein LOC142337415 [Convolutriloba macropyga]|uniref:uncharacterized protein LOC142337415 n=1 Tax=Convolutriloba macropyga TaxID=536237 RepID=UPI003F527766